MIDGLTVEELRKRYPYPQKESDRGNSRAAYCVGGALCLTVGMGIGFPFVTELRDAILIQNPKLPYDMASQFARRIIKLNDAGKFRRAWRTMDRALNAREKE